ncbi:hypothetical protein PPERSA_00229 [Pseudocohnilembus persalinus]|uniref:Uncharacterized protein n=1 Tax=Pseudocohnilembus persalinus TaxID=266149 RepID=A0A0V0Q8Z6_PSEPJ|nr:hypothetical protein PPERSA_00229 [Pseudocohnilembus persalinus]|eukprot:KRW98641.1 hypothetical protein PPERSA_00229 [Pseudocohnilembus persalinus]
MELYAFLCLGRNYHNSNEIKLLFPHEELITKIFNKSDINLTEQLKASLVLILLHVHIDSKPFIEQKKPQFTKILEKNNFQNAIINRSRSLSVGQNASNMSFILDQESNNNQISDNSQQQINFNNNNQQLNTSENNSNNLNESLLAGPRIQLNQINNNNNRNDSMHHQMIELQEQNTAAAQTLNIMMQQGFKDLKIRNILKHLTDYFKSALSKYTILNDKNDNELLDTFKKNNQLQSL